MQERVLQMVDNVDNDNGDVFSFEVSTNCGGGGGGGGGGGACAVLRLCVLCL